MNMTSLAKIGALPVCPDKLKEAGLGIERMKDLFKHVVLGDVSPSYVTKDNCLVNALTDFVQTVGYKYNPCNFYVDRGILPVRGSVGMHTDGGLGLIANWLVYDDQPKESERYLPQLTTDGQGFLDVEVGDVFIFDAELNHGWISNNNCLLVQLTVCPV